RRVGLVERRVADRTHDPRLELGQGRMTVARERRRGERERREKGGEQASHDLSARRMLDSSWSSVSSPGTRSPRTRPLRSMTNVSGRRETPYGPSVLPEPSWSSAYV